MKKLLIVFMLIPTILLAFLNDPINFITEKDPGMQIKFYTNGGKISIYYPIVYKIVSFDTFTETMMFPDIVKGLAYVESGFNIHALSYAGAMGITQFKEDTAKDFGVINAWNPWHALLGTDRMLRFYYEKYGDLTTALAIYNVGESNYENNKIMKENGIKYAEKVIESSKTINRDINLVDRNIYYLQAGFKNDTNTFDISVEVGTLFDIFGQVYFDISSKLITEISTETLYSFELGGKSHIKLDHFNSIVFGYILGYNKEGVYKGPYIGFSFFKPLGYSLELYYDFSKPFSIGNFSLIAGYGQKDWRISFGFDGDFDNLFVEIKF
ncbi:MAG: lytic transglycosylase domain-containing protein [Thermosipho sp. (in: Bacteria)]|nr:lytic transglycosylase domain-containing protein [Thermosipho sp. (in: thermotogales)]